jgi:heme O synthase-like polyprenyltransferase
MTIIAIINAIIGTVSGGAPPPVGNFVITESSDFVITEGGDNIIIE